MSRIKRYKRPERARLVQRTPALYKHENMVYKPESIARSTTSMAVRGFLV
ncbi:MAG TPA: hypothetical protein VMW89_05160 [Desulfatiglandales bacterium]|nr:hypothetical protein [Desulfatiglandales bacterium]